MTKEEIIDHLKWLQTSKDFEAAHGEADEALCKFLETIGHGDVVAEWEKVGKWYA